METKIKYTPYISTPIKKITPSQLNIPSYLTRSFTGVPITSNTNTIKISTPSSTSVADITSSAPAIAISKQDPIVETAKQIVKGITNNSGNYNVGNMQHVINAFENAGISIRITSGLRPGSKTSSGKMSHHSEGNAIDITPNFDNGETWESMRSKLKNSPELIKYLRDNKIGILDETTKDMMKRTGATGAHWHVGPDQNALKGLETLIAKCGMKFQSGGNILVEPDPEPYEYKGFFNNPLFTWFSNNFQKLTKHKEEREEALPFSEDEMMKRQHYAETRFRGDLTSGAGAKGHFQIIPATWNWVVDTNKLGNLDINKFEDNKLVRDYYMKYLSNRPFISKAKDTVKTALTYAAYNMGEGKLKRFIDKEKDKGVDVYANLDWIDDLNPETKRYVNFIVRGIEANADWTNDAFNKALSKTKYYVKNN